MNCQIDSHSGFCFGVTRAITKAEEELKQGHELYCLGDIVHNGQEVERLSALGLQTINHEQMANLHDVRILLRAHGEPPSTYALARQNSIQLIDASCPVVLKLQERIRKAYEAQPNAQIVIYGKKGHAEVVGLVGQTNDTAIVVEGVEDIERLNFGRDIILFSQTTKSIDGFKHLTEEISRRMHSGAQLAYFDTICRNVANRIPEIKRFAAQCDIVFFVGGKKSSNGKVLYEHCLQANPQTHFISAPDELTEEQIISCRNKKVGICGATSTPTWLMEAIAKKIEDQR